MTNQPVPTFGYSHPFWTEAIDLRIRGASYLEIAQVATEKGFPLTYKQVSAGLAKAPINLNLPQTASKWLRRKYEKLETDFSAMSTMRDLVQEALSRAGDAQEELDSDDGTMTNSRRIHLENTRDKWLKEAFNWSRDTATIEVEVGSILAQTGAKQDSGTVVEGEIFNQAKEEILKGFSHKIPNTDESQLAQLYGGDNVRMSDVGLEHEDSDEI